MEDSINKTERGAGCRNNVKSLHNPALVQWNSRRQLELYLSKEMSR